MVPPDEHARSGEHDPEGDDRPTAGAPADDHASASQGDDPPLSELAAAVMPRKKAKTLGDIAGRLPPAPAPSAPAAAPAAPKVPPPPEIAAGTRGRVKTGLAFEFDLGSDAGPVTLNKLTAGPAVRARAAAAPADDEAPTIAREDAGAADALAAEARAALEDPEDSEEAETEEREAPSRSGEAEPAESESSGRSGAPRLPVPGMLGKRSAPEFRDVRRAPKAPMGAGIVPAGGVMPPGAVEAKRAPQNTEMLIDDVAAELMEPEPEPEPEDEEVAVVAPLPSSREGAHVGAAAAASSTAMRDDAGPTAPPRWMIAAAAVLLLGVAVWGLSGGGSDKDVEHAGRAAKASPGEASMVAKVEPPRPAEKMAEPAAEGGDVADANANADADADAKAGDGDAPAEAADDAAAEGGEAPAGDMVIEPEPAPEPEPEPEPAAEATPAATSSKASSKSSRKTTKSRSKSSSPSPSKPASADASSSTAPAPSGSDDPKALLAQAKAALRSGNGSKAYALASKSHKLKYNTDAIEVMTVASCMKKDEARAKSLFKQVPLFQRGGVKNKCKSYGVKVGL